MSSFCGRNFRPKPLDYESSGETGAHALAGALHLICTVAPEPECCDLWAALAAQLL
jgi:hypothetical protein